MMKALIGLLVLGGIALVIVYFVGGVKSFDPTTQGKKAKAAVRPGMTWAQVITAAGAPPGKYRVMMKVKEKVQGEEVETLREGPPLNFDKALFAQDIANKAMPDGFIFEYRYSEQAAFAVSFDGTATAVDVSDLKTMADLLGTRGG